MDAAPNTIVIAAWVAFAAMLGFAFAMARRAQGQVALRVREQALREEYAAYAQLNMSPHATPSSSSTLAERELARTICAVVARHNPCRQAALLLRDGEQQLQVAGSAGIDDLLHRALDEWGSRFSRERRTGPDRASSPSDNARRRSYTITLGPMEKFDSERRFGALGCRQVVILPLWTSSGTVLGALAACPTLGERVNLDVALPPLEALAEVLGRSLDSAAMAARLARAEKMAGLGHLARGVAHELNNPLTAVLGHAELLAATAAELRVRETAQTIATQALRMKETVESLLEFWRPVNSSEAKVDLCHLLAKLQSDCSTELDRRGTRLVLETDSAGPAWVLGHAGRLQQMLEHLVTNAAQAIDAFASDALATSPDKAQVRCIRLTLAREAHTVQLVISDTGAGFADAGRVFDPFYTATMHGDGRSAGLSVAYGIVREHLGEISAFNLHPHGAAVVVELPLAAVMAENSKKIAAVA